MTQPLAHLNARPSLYLRILTPDIEADLAAGRVQRMSGEALCPVCAVAMRQHPTVEQHTWLHYLCDGTLAKG